LIFYFLNNPYKLNNFPLLNSEGELMKISYCWDLTDLNNNLWYGIVLRNIPFETINDVESYFIRAERCKGILYCISVKNINEEFCAILVMEDINEADRMCYKYNNSIIHEKKIKVKFK
jgi:hypothetical protein